MIYNVTEIFNVLSWVCPLTFVLIFALFLGTLVLGLAGLAVLLDDACCLARWIAGCLQLVGTGHLTSNAFRPGALLIAARCKEGLEEDEDEIIRYDIEKL